jgi:hypothetical protein
MKTTFGKLPAKQQQQLFIDHLARNGLPAPVVEYRFAPPRKFRADYAWPEYGILLEQEGGVYTGQAHGSVTGILRDMEKYNLAAVRGWRVIRVLPSAMLSNETITLLQQIFQGKKSA